MAVGVLGLAHWADEGAWYVVMSEEVPRAPVQVTAGFQRDDSGRGLVGVQYGISEAWTAYADWETGPEAFATLGVGRTLSKAASLTLYYARSNTAREDDYVGLYLNVVGMWK